MRDVSSHLRLWVFAVAGLIADLWSKQWAFTRLDPDPYATFELVPNLLTLRRTLNDGALFGLGSGLWAVFILASVLALGFVCYLFSQSTRERRSLHIGLGLILAGAVGNLYDRAFVQVDVVRVGRERYVGRLVRQDDRYVHVAPWPEGAPSRPILKTADFSVRKQGVVRDFIKIEPKIAGLDVWPWVFNIADVWLVVGVGLLLLNFWWDRRATRDAERQAAAESNSAAPAA